MIKKLYSHKFSKLIIKIILKFCRSSSPSSWPWPQLAPTVAPATVTQHPLPWLLLPPDPTTPRPDLLRPRRSPSSATTAYTLARPASTTQTSKLPTESSCLNPDTVQAPTVLLRPRDPFASPTPMVNLSS